uniref:Uncharacterized protein n=1 Tax=Nelumbo nucifera TaxID=4432 RepID=A0A822ZU22_NELNU|nr:TPA_asm: hypothetical protein HUJ06_016782 [Nelumbo nucifera]
MKTQEDRIFATFWKAQEESSFEALCKVSLYLKFLGACNQVI